MRLVGGEPDRVSGVALPALRVALEAWIRYDLAQGREVVGAASGVACRQRGNDLQRGLEARVARQADADGHEDEQRSDDQGGA